MQPLGRGDLTDDQVRALITGDSVEISAGLELLNPTDGSIEDISDDLVGGDVERDNYAEVHGSCRLQILRRLAWGRDRVRPYLVLSNSAVSARFDLGLYVLTTPTSKRGENPTTYDVAGYDLLQILSTTGPGDTYEVPTGATYLQAVRDAVAASGIDVPVRLDGSGQNSVLPVPMVWALPEEVTWLRVINDLLSGIGYIGVYANSSGELRSRPYQALTSAAPEWTLDTSDDRTNIVGQDRTITEDVWKAPNWWRFVQSNRETTPTEGAGVYTVQNINDGPTSQNSLGRVVRAPVQYLDVADHAALVSAGDRVVDEARQVFRSIELEIDPLPVMSHRDVFTLTDDGVTEKLIAASWTLSLGGSPGRLSLGGDKPAAKETREQQTKATVTQANPLRIQIDGAETDSTASTLDSASYTVGDRVTVTVRNPSPPLVQGVES